MPAEDRLRRDEQCRPPLSWDGAGKRATSAQSDQAKRARPTWHQRTASSWRKTRISASLRWRPSSPRGGPRGWMDEFIQDGEHPASSLANPILAGQGGGYELLDPSGSKAVATGPVTTAHVTQGKDCRPHSKMPW